jgi:hypothetical protein
MFVIVGAANRSGSIAQAGMGFIVLSGGAAAGFWMIHKISGTSGG